MRELRCLAQAAKRKAKRINCIYESSFTARAAAEKAAQEQGEPFDFDAIAARYALPERSGETLDRAWNDLSLALQRSSIYAAHAIPTKLRSLGTDSRRQPPRRRRPPARSTTAGMSNGCCRTTVR